MPEGPLSPNVRDALKFDQDDAEEYPPINPPFKRKPVEPESPEDFDQQLNGDFPKVFEMPEMTPQIMPSRSTHFKHVKFEVFEKKRTGGG